SLVPVRTLSSLTNVQFLSTYAAYTCTIAAPVGVACWGSGANGVMEDGMAGGHAISAPTKLSFTLPATAIMAGNQNSCAILNGAAWCWGYNGHGELGNGTTTDQLTAGPVSGLTSGVQAIAPGFFHNCALVNGGVWCWGSNY